MPQTKLHLSTQCLISNCPGCDHGTSYELYIPAPARSGLDATFEHHITTRNFFAWLYGLPLTGRALGKAIVDLKLRIDTYRPGNKEQNGTDVISFAEAQNYLDFRECVDHALAALRLAEALRVPDLWIDAFAHCVGMSHRGLRESIEYKVSSTCPKFGVIANKHQHLSDESKYLITQARLGMDLRLQKVCETITSFFETELSSGFLGLSQAAREHLDRFRSFLHAYYIEKHGFWPPNRFEEEVAQLLICKRMYTDFKNLYEHLVDTRSSASNMDAVQGTTGGVCVLQNVKNFDNRQRLPPLPQPLPRIPSTSNVNVGALERKQRRNSWNPIVRHREDKERRNTQRMQALIDSTNRDWTLMNCVLVRRFSEFEIETAVDELESISLSDGRKVRWIVVYAILQILQSITQAPEQVRNTEGLSYALCCEAPALMPWDTERGCSGHGADEQSSPIEPDLHYSHTNTAPPSPGGNVNRTLSMTSLMSLSSGSVKRSSSTTSTVKERRKTIGGENVERSLSRKSSKARSSSLRRFVSVKKGELDEDIPAVPKLKQPTKRASFCEIYVPGYGNGLNIVQKTESVTTLPLAEEDDQALPTLPGNASVSRESSNASNNSTWSKTSSDGGTEASTPDGSHSDLTEKGTLRPELKQQPESGETGLDTVHFNTETWDDMLTVLERRRFNITT